MATRNISHKIALSPQGFLVFMPKGIYPGNKKHNLLGMKFGRWVVIKYISRSNWLCECRCGNVGKVNAFELVRGFSKSCGCNRIDNPNRTTHGFCHNRFYEIWKGIKQRCLNKNSLAFKHYGGRGIKICGRWLKFENFRDDMYGSYLKHVKKFGEKNTQIERIDNNGDYSPDNCKWATDIEQKNNTRLNILITHNGQTLSLSQWATKFKISYSVLYQRVRRYGYTFEEAITEC